MGVIVATFRRVIMDRYDELNRKYLNLVVEKQISDTNLKEAEGAIIILKQDVTRLKKVIDNRWIGRRA